MTLLMPDQISLFNPRGRILAMDLGQKTIGLAVSDSMHSLALPLFTIKRKKYTEDINKLIPILKEYDVTDYVLGWPLNMDGSRSAGCDRVQSFADEMQKSTHIFGTEAQILLWDERLSTDAVEKTVNKSVEKMKQSGELDALAAQIILDGMLRRISLGKN
jgi:putative Holliday junction resolvase